MCNFNGYGVQAVQDGGRGGGPFSLIHKWTEYIKIFPKESQSKRRVPHSV